ncbi:glycosyltransferase family 4 protein [Fusobacterium sp. MFO224]|uniref:glycosyltransferase family 4 protein n=1 Tax=Fusobacterium sp. MFO224 TaxID=3378070 RepID=UPI003855582C
MKILWVVNIVMPEVANLLKEKVNPFGGWLVNSSKNLSEEEGIELTVAFPYKGIKKSLNLKGKKINYYPFKAFKDRDKNRIKKDEVLMEILKKEKPDIVHIYGTEFAHSLSMVNLCKLLDIKIIVSIQGLVSYCSQHMYANLPVDAIYGMTFRNFIRRDNVDGLKKLFYKRGIRETEVLNKVENVIGRTNWDRACSLQTNPKLNYYFCNEILRESFYKNTWNIEKCERNSIFLSQSQYSIKGLHHMVEALPIILKFFPNTKVYVGGKNIIKSSTLKDKILLTYYGKYIKNLIKKLGLKRNIIFTGLLNEKQMCKRYLKSHLFVCPSSIENSPNSLGEAMLLGVPCVASYVGGIPDILKDKEEGFLYQTDAPYMLAYYICKIFEDDELALKLSKNSKEHAEKTHSVILNTKRLIEIYKKLSEA